MISQRKCPQWTTLDIGGESPPSGGGPSVDGLDPTDLLCPWGLPEGRNVALGTPVYWHELSVKSLFQCAVGFELSNRKNKFYLTVVLIPSY